MIRDFFFSLKFQLTLCAVIMPPMTTPLAKKNLVIVSLEKFKY